MSYQIIYEGHAVEKVPLTEKKNKSAKQTVILWTLMICFVLAYFLHDGAKSLRKHLLPGDPAVTQAAFSAFSDDLRAGESIKDAFTDFCLEIINNGQPS